MFHVSTGEETKFNAISVLENRHILGISQITATSIYLYHMLRIHNDDMLCLKLVNRDVVEKNVGDIDNEHHILSGPVKEIYHEHKEVRDILAFYSAMKKQMNKDDDKWDDQYQAFSSSKWIHKSTEGSYPYEYCPGNADECAPTSSARAFSSDTGRAAVGQT